MRHFAMTGIETAAMIPSIMSGSLIRATPPCTLMSAGTRSRAMTATAPASSAIFACSAVTTSMITPPLSMSAMPRLTRAVPVTAMFAVPAAAAASPARAALLTDTMNLTRSLLWLCSMVGAPGPPLRPVPPPPGAAPGSGHLPRCVPTAGEVGHVRPDAFRAAGHDRIVDLEELRQRRTARQPEQADQPAAARGPGDSHCVVVELARQEHLMGGRLQLSEQFVAPSQRGQRGPEARLAQRRPQRPGQIALGQLVRRTGGPGVVRGPGQ